MNQEQNSIPVDTKRRGLLTSLYTFGGLLFAGFGYMAFEYIRTSKLPRASEFVITKTKDLFATKKNTVVQFNGRKVFVQQQSPTEYTALSMICTHGSCTVEWQERSSIFVCPCHNGAFHSNGTVLRTPPQRPLTALKTTYTPSTDQLTLIETEL